MGKIKIAITLFVILGIVSCKKDEVETTPTASLTLVNAVVGGKTAKLGGNSTSASNNSYNYFALYTGENDLYVWPLGDSASPYFKYPKFSVNDREIYSLFVYGQPGSTEGLILKENIP